MIKIEYLIRKREKKDCETIAHIVTETWNTTYKGIVPDCFLEELKKTEEERIAKAINEFDENNNNILVLEVNKEIVGFTKYGEANDTELYNCGEIIALYILRNIKA